MYLYNGEVKHCIEFSDRGFQYGDGLFETIEIVNGSPVFLKQHFQRLDIGCQKLLIPTPDLKTLKAEAFDLSSGIEHGVLKLIVTRGSGGRGYRQPDKINPTRLFSIHPYPNYPVDLEKTGVNVRFCQTRLGLSPSLAGVKHMNRLEQILARSEWDSADVHEGIMMDINNNVIEGTMSNVFLVKDHCLYTPSLTQCGVEGVLRSIIMQLSDENSIPVIEKNISQDDIYNAQELFISNSIIGIWPIRKIENQCFKIGVLTQKLQSLFLDIKQQDVNEN